MTPGVYVAGTEPATGKSAIALGVQQLLARRVRRLGVFRPVVADRDRDPLLDLLHPDFVPYEAACGVGYEDVRADEPRALEEIVARYRALAAQCDGVLVIGTDFAGVGTASELAVASCPCDDRNLQFHVPQGSGDAFREGVFTGLSAGETVKRVVNR